MYRMHLPGQEPEEMEPTRKQGFCALVHGSARLDDHAIIGDVTHERTVQRRVRQRTHELWMGTFTSGRARRSDSNQAFSLCPLVIRQERGMRHGAVHPPVLGHGCGEDLKGASKQALAHHLAWGTCPAQSHSSTQVPAGSLDRFGYNDRQAAQRLVVRS